MKKEKTEGIEELVPYKEIERVEKRMERGLEVYTESEQQVLRKMKKVKEVEWENNITKSLQRGLSIENEEGNNVIDELVSKMIAGLRARENISINDMLKLKELLGENVNKTESKSLSVNITQELAKVTDKEKF